MSVIENILAEMKDKEVERLRHREPRHFTFDCKHHCYGNYHPKECDMLKCLDEENCAVDTKLRWDEKLDRMS